MATAETTRLELLYERDETAWLEIMAALAAEGRTAEMDLPNLNEFLTSMANRDRREVRRRLVVLLTHLLKWEYQPAGRGVSWKLTIRGQRRELRQLLESRTLPNHAEDVFAEAYTDAREYAEVETGLDLTTFPTTNPWTLDEVLADADA